MFQLIINTLDFGGVLNYCFSKPDSLFMEAKKL